MLSIKSKSIFVVIALFSAGVGSLACNVLNPVICTLEFRYGIFGTVADVNGQPVPGLTVTITALNYSETASVFNGIQYVGAGERQGTYTIMYQAPGFTTRTVTGVVVTGDECHVTPVRQDAVLTRI